VDGRARAAGHEALAVAGRGRLPDRPAVAGPERHRSGQRESCTGNGVPGARVRGQPRTGAPRKDAPAAATASRQTGPTAGAAAKRWGRGKDRGNSYKGEG